MPPTTHDGLPGGQRTWAIIGSGVSIVVAVLDGAMTSVALPTIARDLSITPAASIWVVNGYQLAVTISLLPLAALGERIGYARVFRSGLVIILFASILCMLAGSLTGLAAARVLQGFGAACIMSVNSAMIRHIHPRHQLGRGIGINAMVVATSSAVGPTVASAILAVAHWQWLFALNIPMAAVALVLSRHLPAVPGSGRAVDWTSTALNALTFGLFILALDGAGQGHHPLLVVALLAAGVGFGIAFVRLQLRIPAPVLPVDLLRLPVFALSIATSILSFLAQMLAYVSLPFYLQDVLGRTAVETGLLMTPWPVMTVIMAPIAGRLADRHQAGILGGIGLMVMAVGLALLATMPATVTASGIAWRMAVCGIGFGFFQTPNNRAILLSAPLERSGGASGMLSTARLLGQTTGAALVALIFAWHGRSAAVEPLAIAAACAGLGAVASSLRLASWARA